MIFDDFQMCLGFEHKINASDDTDNLSIFCAFVKNITVEGIGNIL